MREPWTHGFVLAGGLRFHYVEAGPKDGPLVLLLHGFPEFFYSWRHQIPSLAARGLRVVAPDLRGYNLSDKPRGADAYDLDRLAGDVVGLIAAFGAERADIVGHDFGGAVAWHTAMHHGERVRRLAVLNCAHPVDMGRALLRDPRQLLRSWYMFLFQIPRVPELILGGGRVPRMLRRAMVRKDALTDEDAARYAAAFEEPGALTAALDYYRAAFRRLPRARHERHPPLVTAPTLVLWGERDVALRVQLIADVHRRVSGPLRVERLPGAGHFVQQDAPEEVNRYLGEFLTASDDQIA